MGLDVHFYEKTTPVAHSAAYPFDDEECWDEHIVVHVSDFPDQADGITDRSCFVYEGGDKHLHNSYSGYNQYRAWLCMAVFGVEPKVVWEDPETYRDRPFYSQINFADNEGTIGPVTARSLADDYASQREEVVSRMRAIPQRFDVSSADHLALIERMVDTYDEWAAGFALAADTGLVQFR